jgi:ribosomal-protein-alanine N-acetyltransferase
VSYIGKFETIETERLLLRRPTSADGGTIGALLGDPEVMRLYGSGRTYALTEVSEILSLVDRHYEQYGYGVQMISLKKTGAAIGLGGLQHALISPCVQIGGVLVQGSWNMGYAIECGSALLQVGFDTLKLERIEANTPVENVAAIAVSRKLGMVYEGVIRHEGTEYARFATHGTTLKGLSG